MGTVESIEQRVRACLVRLAPDLQAEIDRLDSAARVWEVVDSMMLLDLLDFIEAEFKVKVAALDVVPENFSTLANIVRYVSERLPAT